MKKTDLPYLRRKFSKSGEYWYFERMGERVRLPSPDDPDFLRAYDAARSGRAPITGARTWLRLIADYRATQRWQNLAPRTKRDYESVLAWVADKMPHADPSKMRRPHVIRAQETNADRVRWANYIVQVLSILFDRAISLGWMDHNPAKGVPMLKPARGPALHKPWPIEIQVRFCDAAPIGSPARTAFEIGLGLSQRTGDNIGLLWSAYDGQGFSIVQNKTGTALYLPVSDRLRTYLDQIPRPADTVLTGLQGKPLTYSGAYQVIRRVLRLIEATDYTPHGLRYTVAAEIAAMGGTDDEIMSLTGHKSKGMAMQYAGSARQKAHAARAQERRNKSKTDQET